VHRGGSHYEEDRGGTEERSFTNREKKKSQGEKRKIGKSKLLKFPRDLSKRGRRGLNRKGRSFRSREANGGRKVLRKEEGG